MGELPNLSPKRKGRSLLGYLGRLFILLFWLIAIVVAGVGAFLLSFALSPPFGSDTTARVLLIGLDQEELGVSRSDTIILTAVKLDGNGASLISVPRDSYVRIPGRRSGKINAAYAEGEEKLLQKTLAQPHVLNADLPYYVTFNSQTVAAIIDALGGIEVVVPHDMNYDDHWGKLHIHLKAGNRHLDGVKTVGFLRWRKNNRGRGASGDDFMRAERQRQVMVAIKEKLRTWDGMRRLPAVYKAFQKHGKTNLTLPQFMLLAWNAREITPGAVPGVPQTRRGVSYVICDWDAGRRMWRQAIGAEAAQ